MRALLLLNGELYKREVLRSRIRDKAFDLVLAADGGARHAPILNVMMDAVVGDMDSLPGPERQNISGVGLVSYPAEKDESDLELALNFARKKGADEIVMVGAMGGRMDTTIANILLAAHANLGSGRVEVWHGEQTGWVIRPPGEDIGGRPGDTVSLIPLAGDAIGITTKGMKYPLRNEDLHLGSSRGMSNVVEGLSPQVTLFEGLLLAVHTPWQGMKEDGGNMTERRTVNVGVQVLPMVDDVYGVVDKAIQVIQASGFKYEVGPLETTMEGDDLDKLLEVAKAAHRACFEAGASKVVTIIKIADAPECSSIEGKVGKYRKRDS